jgi:transaldolase
MEQQALRIASWGDNVYVKIPITNTRGESAAPLVYRLAQRGVKINVTAVMTLDQVEGVIKSLRYGPPSCISIFAGRVADAGCDPLPILCGALARMRFYPQIELIWASPRELFNIVQADAIGCHIITVTHDLLKKLPLIGRDLNEYSLDTVKMFFEDARAAGFTLNTEALVH